MTMRPSTFVLAILAAAIGAGVILVNVRALTIPIMVFAGIFLLLAVALADFEDFRRILGVLAPYIPRSRAWKARRSTQAHQIPDDEPEARP